MLGTFNVHWDPPRLYEIETDEGFSLEWRIYGKNSAGWSSTPWAGCSIAMC
jgi:hypothetical protein